MRQFKVETESGVEAIEADQFVVSDDGSLILLRLGERDRVEQAAAYSRDYWLSVRPVDG